jgi:peptidoglycan/LPS O-acetylase OafA/YrhL
MKSEKIYFENLDSIRFIATTMVFLSHAVSSSYENISNNYLKNILNLISSGATGVSIFFVLSGFLITYLLISEYQLNSKISIKKFYIRRVLRIWPLYFTVFIISLAIFPFSKTIEITERMLYGFSFLSNYVKCNYAGVLMPEGITWSVCVEEQFYLFWPLIFVFLPYRFWLFTILITIISSIIFRIINYNNNPVLYFHSLSVLLDLGIGGLFAYLIKEHKKIRSFFEKASTKTHFAFFLISFSLLYLNVKIFDFKYGHAIGRFFISMSFAFIICAQAITKSNSILNLRNFHFANKWGKYTYGMYLIHPIILLLVGLFAESVNFSKQSIINTLLIGAISFILTLYISKLSYVYFESNFLKLKDKFTVINTQ